MEEKILSKKQEQELKNSIYTSLVNEPSRYTIDVLNNSSLPDNLKSKKELDFEIKPPVLSTLSKVSLVLNTMPKDVFESNHAGAVDLLKYISYSTIVRPMN